MNFPQLEQMLIGYFLQLICNSIPFPEKINICRLKQIVADLPYLIVILSSQQQYIFNILRIDQVMIKYEDLEEPEENRLIKDLIKKIKQKLTNLGYSSKEIHQQLITTINQVFKLKVSQPKQLQKVVLKKLSSEKMSKKIINEVIVELDLYLNSIHDNYESSIEECQPLKLESPCLEDEPAKKNMFDGISRKERMTYWGCDDFSSLREKLPKRTFFYKDPIAELSRTRKYFEKLSKLKEVKLEYIQSNDDS